jgi:hypothetical protein
MPTIISRRKIAFFNPNIHVLTVSDQPRSPKYNEAVFITKGEGELETAPDWINAKLGPATDRDGSKILPVRDKNQQNLNTWAHHEADGHIMEVQVKAGPKSQLEEEAATRQAEAARKASETPEVEFKTPEELAAMNKGDIQSHAEENHGLKLPNSMPKDDMIAAVIEAQAKKAA